MTPFDPEACALTEDQKPWLQVARRVMAGEFDRADRSTRESVIFGLEGLRHHSAAEAIARLRGKGVDIG